MRRILIVLAWILLFVVIAALVYFVWTRFINRETDISIGSTVTLECTSECQQHGQCGTSTESPKIDVILAGLDQPTVEPLKHDTFIPAGVKVTVRDSRSEKLQQTNERQFDQQFSRVEWRNSIGDIQRTGWIADWCIK